MNFIVAMAFLFIGLMFICINQIGHALICILIANIWQAAEHVAQAIRRKS